MMQLIPYITGLKRPDRNIAHDYNRGSDTVKNSIPNFFKGVKIKKSHLSSFLLIYFPFSPLPPALQFKPFPNFRQLKKTNLLFNNSHPFSSIFLKFIICHLPTSGTLFALYNFRANISSSEILMILINISYKQLSKLSLLKCQL